MSIEFIQASLLKGVEIRADLLKWKLILVGGIGTLGIGTGNTRAPWILILIPIICAYVDLIYRNSCLRRNKLCSFVLRNKGNRVYSALAALLAFEHERSMESMRGFSFESGAVFLSSIILSIGVASYPWILQAASGELAESPDSFVIAGLFGIVLALVIESSYWYLDRENNLKKVIGRPSAAHTRKGSVPPT